MLAGLSLSTGNIRELANEIERAVILADPGAPITDDLLSEHVQQAAAEGAAPGCSQRRTDTFERDQIVDALATGGRGEDQGRRGARAHAARPRQEDAPPRALTQTGTLGPRTPSAGTRVPVETTRNRR